MVLFGVYDVVWCCLMCMAQCGVVWCVWRSVMLFGVYDVVWCCLVCMAQCDVVWCVWRSVVGRMWHGR